MELKIEHLAPYLPYELNLQYIVREKVEQTGIMKSISHNEYETHPTKVSISAMYNEEHIWMFKPLLRDLSQFEQDHINLVKEFIGIGKWCDEYDNYFDIWFYYSEMVQDLVLQCPYEIAQFFFKNHYDVFGLIDAGLASELNNKLKQ
jgi:hypothetical protein